VNPRTNTWVIAAAAAALILGVILSRMIERGVRVEKVMLAEETPALRFIPAGPEPHPVALLAHGFAGSKETLFRYGEALAAAGFICYSVDQPGHGASPRKFTFMETVHTLEAVAREVGPVDVFAGHSMGGATGGEAVREGGMRPGLFMAIGAMPVLGDHGPPLLLLAGQFEEALTPDLLKTRTDAQVVISPWCDHLLEAFDPVLVNAAVGVACTAVHKTPPPPPTAWRWRLLGAVLAMLAAGKLASCLTISLPRLARFRGLLIGGFVTAAFMITLCGKWIDATPHLRLQVIALPVIILLAVMAGRLRIPRWSFVVLSVLATVLAVSWFRASPSLASLILMASTLLLTPTLIAGTVIGWYAERGGSRLQGDLAMAIFLGCAPFQCLELPLMPLQPAKPQTVIKLDTKLLDACVGEYEIAPNNVFLSRTKVTIRRDEDHLIWQAFGNNALEGDLELNPVSETDFILETNGAEVTFIKNDQGEAVALIHQIPQLGLPESKGKKLKNK
jgi:hypothetical protein